MTRGIGTNETLEMTLQDGYRSAINETLARMREGATRDEIEAAVIVARECRIALSGKINLDRVNWIRVETTPLHPKCECGATMTPIGPYMISGSDHTKEGHYPGCKKVDGQDARPGDAVRDPANFGPNATGPTTSKHRKARGPRRRSARTEVKTDDF